MSIRRGLLALLAEHPMHGYQLRAEFEARTGGTWPLNIGQAYTTLERLERDGLVEPLDDDDDDGPERFVLTETGRSEVAAWWRSPVTRGSPARDELAIKLALAVTVPGVDVRELVENQRAETVRGLQDYTRLKFTRTEATNVLSTEEDMSSDSDLAWELVLDSLIFAAQAEVQWLDHVEERVARAAAARAAGGRHVSRTRSSHEGSDEGSGQETRR